MGVISGIKLGWQQGRDSKKLNKTLRNIFDETDKTTEVLDEELGPSDDRFYRHLDIAYKQKNPELMFDKYPRGFYADEDVRKMGLGGVAASVIAENLPRKKKTSSKPKRKIIKKCSCKKK